MNSFKPKYQEFINENFKGLKLRKPLFYNWKFGLRFNLQAENINTEKYFEEVNKRAVAIFETTFSNTDNIFLILTDYKFRRKKIRFSNYIFNQIDNLKKQEISYSKVKKLYEPNDELDIRNIAAIKLTTKRLNYRNILSAIANSDFLSRQPRYDKRGVFTDAEIYIINIDKKIILNMYDDRGLDIICTDKDTIFPIYKKYNDLILDFDRKKIDNLFV